MSDLISRKAVLKQIQKIECEPGYQHVGEDWAVGLIIAENIVESAESIESTPSAEPERKWIPVTEALPENTKFVLLTIRRLDKSYSQIPFISVGYVSWNQSAWWCAHDGDCDAHNVEVLAWMPLPEPAIIGDGK